jgi:1,4-dihydroxy-6-naphthoate synthase
METLDFAISPCPNDTFAFDALLHEKIIAPFKAEVSFHDIQTLNLLALEGRHSVIKTSGAILPLIDSEYELLQSGAALGMGMGPKVVAKRAMDLKGKRVATAGFLTTAHLLFSSFFKDSFLVEMPYHLIEAAVKNNEVDAGILIHESRFTHNLHELFDLGTLFHEKYKTPLVLGVVVAKKNLGKKRIEQIEKALYDSILFARQNPQSSKEFVKSQAQEKKEDIIQKHIELYVTSETEKLTQEGHHAIQTMYMLCNHERGKKLSCEKRSCSPSG